jgi:hypothetical protein
MQVRMLMQGCMLYTQRQVRFLWSQRVGRGKRRTASCSASFLRSSSFLAASSCSFCFTSGSTSAAMKASSGSTSAACASSLACTQPSILTLTYHHTRSRHTASSSVDPQHYDLPGPVLMLLGA